MNEQDKKRKIEKIFKLIDKHIVKIYIAIALICIMALILAVANEKLMNKYDISTGVYSYKDRKNNISLELVQHQGYNNKYISDGKDNNILKETEDSIPIYTNNRYDNRLENYTIKADIPYINILDTSNVDIIKLKEEIKRVEEDIMKIRQTFRGNNLLEFSYTAYNYGDFLSFAYHISENFEDTKINKVEALVYNTRKKNTVSLKEYLKTIGVSEYKFKRAISEIKKQRKIDFKYTGKNKFYVTNQGDINILINENESILVKLSLKI